MARPEKEAIVSMVKEKLQNSQGAVLTDYRGLNVAEITELRNKLREAKVEFKVIKNTLTKRAADELGIEGLDPYLEGPTAIAFGMEDPVAPAKILADFAKTHNQLELKVGILDGKVIDKAKIKELAELPSKAELIAKVLGGMSSPLYGFAGSLQGILRNFVYVLNAVKDKKAAEA
ncbi:50S ribosomal protein L10 [Thermincola ferriacetica]|uniref:Large ribosomal subunit protein uL10 n=1 Tax=Thermincola ferriacetica TaxID=281456 RepID=A0A0L6W1T1_9FIRM|nr:50S ribosomal protein L10 [Thermincola ferriacetica]KNZ69490.1 50S ribosomal protein L10 [Thermincola ferriacetica]